MIRHLRSGASQQDTQTRLGIKSPLPRSVVDTSALLAAHASPFSKHKFSLICARESRHRWRPSIRPDIGSLSLSIRGATGHGLNHEGQSNLFGQIRLNLNLGGLVFPLAIDYILHAHTRLDPRWKNGTKGRRGRREDGTGASRARPNGKWRKIEGNRFEGIFHEWIDGFRFFL